MLLSNLFQVLRFRSQFITDELAQVFMDTDSEGEFEGFGKEDDSLCNSWMSPLVTDVYSEYVFFLF